MIGRCHGRAVPEADDQAGPITADFSSECEAAFEIVEQSAVWQRQDASNMDAEGRSCRGRFLRPLFGALRLGRRLAVGEVDDADAIPLAYQFG